jgi:ParB-like chromosome segregation protein Spo0J
MQIQQMPIEALIPYAKNSRVHDDAQVAQIAGSIREFGFTNPVLVDAEGGIIAGHGRVLAARKLGLVEVPCIELSHLSDVQRRAYVIADNKLGLNSSWDDELLKIELEALHDDGFGMELLGFGADELEAAMGIQGELDGDAPEDKGISYQENFAVLVECTDEANQQTVFERLSAMGFTCKVLVN